MEAESSNLPLSNTVFPPPPAIYKQYTTENVGRLEQYRSLKGKQKETSEWDDIRELDNPRADWVVEEGSWGCYGKRYALDPHIPTAEEIGLPRLLVDQSSTETPQQSLPALLRSYLHTHLLLVDALVKTPRAPHELDQLGMATEGDQYIQHLSNISANMMVAVNELRQVQAEETLELILQEQIAKRKEQTAALKTKSLDLARVLADMRKPTCT